LSQVALFAYGSLVDPASVAITLGHDAEGLGPAQLAGWRRRWSQARDNARSEKTFARSDHGSLPTHCLGLNVELAEGEPGPNGALYAIGEADLERMDLREIRYDRVDVSDAVEGAGEGLRVITYVAKAANFSPEPPAGAVILRNYLETVEAAFDALGPGQLDLFRETTGPPPVEVIDGELVRDEIPPGNPRAW
jgi:hypothetical protein